LETRYSEPEVENRIHKLGVIVRGCQKEKYSNETKLFSSIKFNVLGSRADNKINNDMLAMLYTSN
jgi:hypothetical protein